MGGAGVGCERDQEPCVRYVRCEAPLLFEWKVSKKVEIRACSYNIIIARVSPYKYDYWNTKPQ